MSLRQALCDPWLMCNVLGLALAAGTWALVLGAAVLLLRELLLLPPRHAAYTAAHGTLFALLAALALAAHARTALTDPGSVPPGTPRDSNADAEAVGLCPYCGAVQLPRAYHCMVCRCCVRRMDHHCPWVNNCVGEDNQRHFVLFLLYISLASLHVLLLLGVPALRSYASGEWGAHSTLMPDRLRLFLLLLALMGFFLTTPMFCMQIIAICTDTTWIELLLEERPTGSWGSVWDNLKAVFGPRVSLAWINPFATPPPRRTEGLHDVV